jgi:hypothetical protein
MSLAPSERKALAVIEASLRTTDPRLAARMATFTALVSRGRIPRWKCLSPWRLRIRRFRVAGLVTAMLILTVVCGLLGLRGHASTTSPSRCGIAVEKLAGCHDQPLRRQHAQSAGKGAAAGEQGAGCPADPACIAP